MIGHRQEGLGTHTDFFVSAIPLFVFFVHHTRSYDCFYMWGPNNHFNSNGDGGYINLAVVTRGDKCTFDGKTSDVYCK